MELDKSVAVVTGGASGIGESVAKTMAPKGVKVVIGDMDRRTSSAWLGEITAAGGQVAFAKCNVTSDEQVADLMDLAIARSSAR
jgi:2-keto-3-deoxy-L-fuconate dehydrogenase